MGKYQRQTIAFLWALAVVVSFNSASPLPLNLSVQWTALLANICAVILLVRPDSVRCLQVSIVSYLLTAFTIMPSIPNHRVVLLFAGVAILVGTLRSSPLSQKTIANLKWLTIVVYIFAVLAKCNYDYLHAEVSCASRFFSEALELHGLAVSGYAVGANEPSLVGYWSLIAECFILILLLPVRTRGIAVVLGILFHICLATHYAKYFANFSSAMFLLLFAWLSEEQCQRIEARYLRDRRGLLVFWVLLLYGALAACALGAIDVSSWMIVRYALWLILSAFLLFVVARGVTTTPIKNDNRVLGVPSLLFVMVAILNGLSPYLGIKTRAGFSMYSNLRIEPDYSNHIFMPTSLDLAGYLSDTVRIVETRDQTLLRQIGAMTERLPYISICAYIAEMDDGPRGEDATVSYERNGQLVTAQRGGALPDDCPSWIARKFLLFGPVGVGSERSCIW